MVNRLFHYLVERSRNELFNALDLIRLPEEMGSMVITIKVLEYTYVLHIMVAFKWLPERFPL